MLDRLRDFPGITVTFSTTENCNLRCKYCYEINKKDKYMSIETAKQAIDKLIVGTFFTKENEVWAKKGIILEFLGGDSLINPQLVDEILTYWNYKLITVENKWTRIWRHAWRASLCSNGTLFEREDVRQFCEKWQEVLCLAVSIDGCPEIHDKYRVFPNGSGTMDTIKKWRPWYTSVFKEEGMSTKSTASKATIPYLFESLKYMYEELGIKWINQNFIMEDMHLTDEDLEELKHQLKLCREYVFEHRDDIYWALVSDTYSDYRNSLSDNTSHCGSGTMLTIGIDGRVYACMRWLPLSQGDHNPDMSIGTVKDGFTKKGRKTYKDIYKGSISKNCTKEEKCKTCEYESACTYCIAGCFAEYSDFTRTTHICEVTKILCESAKIYKQMELDADKE